MSSDAAVWRSENDARGYAIDTEPTSNSAAPPAGTRLEVRRLVRADGAVVVAQLVAHRAHEDAVAQLERTDTPRRQQMSERVRHDQPP